MNNSDTENRLSIKVVGIGGAEIRALESMDHEPLNGIEFIALETAVESALNNSSAPTKSQYYNRISGASGKTEKECFCISEETVNEVDEALNGADLVILVAGMGGRIVTRASLFVANVARNLGADTVCIAILPSSGDDQLRREIAEDAICALIKKVDWLIVVPNDGLTDIRNPTTGLQTDKACDAIIIEAVRGITNQVIPGSRMNFDYADFKSLLPSKYPVTFGVGEASGINRAEEALFKALHPLSRGGVDIGQATDVLVTITGSCDMAMDDYNTVSRIVHEKVYANANIKISVVSDDDMGDSVKVTIYLSKMGK